MTYQNYEYPSMQIMTAKTDKFKNAYIEVNFREDIRKMNPASRVFLSSLMTYNSNIYKTRRELKIKQEELYNIEFGGTCERNGYNVITSFQIDFLDPKFIKDTDYLDNCLDFLFTNISNPNIDGSSWEIGSYEVIKERLHVAVDNYKENPSSYAKVEFSKELFHGGVASDRLLNSHEQINEVTRESLVKSYYEMLENSYCDVSIVGNLDMNKIVKKITTCFIRPKVVTKKIPNCIKSELEKYYEIQRYGKYKQTQVFMGYLLDEFTYKERFYIVPIFNRIFGASGLSDKLGKYLRMDNSLCYTYYSEFSVSNSAFYIYTGIKKENIDVAVACIKKAFKEMQRADFTESELLIKKKQFLSELDLEQDSIYGIANHMYFHYVFGTPTYEELRKNVMAITKKDISSLTKKMHLTLLYVLKEETDARN